MPVATYTVIVTAGSGPCAGSTPAAVNVAGGTVTTVDTALTEPGTGYAVTAGARAFEPVTGVLDLTGDDAYTQLTLPFQVELYGQSYTTAWVDTNGVVSFVEPDGPSHDTAAIPSAAAPNQPNAAVYPFWDDLIVDDQASVLTGVAGSAPDRRFIIEWRDVSFFENQARRVSFQVVFHEDGAIAIAWDGVDGTLLEQGGDAVVGIENADGSQAWAYSQFTSVVRSGQGVRFQPS